MLESVNIIINSTFDEIKNSEKVLILMKTYSILFNQNQKVNFCEACLKGYYEKIKSFGLQKATEYMKAINHTFKLKNWNGSRYVPATGQFINPNFLSDEKAINLIENGYLSESDFEILPENYKKDPIISEIKEKIKENISIPEKHTNHIPEVGKKVKKNKR